MGESPAPAVLPGSCSAQARQRVAVAELRVIGKATSVGIARSFAVAVAGELGADRDARDCVRALVSELVTNVVLHALTDAVIRVREDGVAYVLIDVVDGSPVLPAQSRIRGPSTTGRGLRLLKVLAAESGVQPDAAVAPGGKCVWFRLAKHSDAASERAVQEATSELFVVSGGSHVMDGQDVIRSVPEPDDFPAGSTLLTVRVLAAPLALWSQATQHTAELMREFALLRIGSESGLTRDMSARLLDVVCDLRARYAGVSSSQAAQLNAALDAGETSRDFTYSVPPEMVPGCVSLLALLDEADEYCADGRELMTQVSTPEQRAFRHWYLGAFIDQVAGAEPVSWPDFRRASGP